MPSSFLALVSTVIACLPDANYVRRFFFRLSFLSFSLVFGDIFDLLWLVGVSFFFSGLGFIHYGSVAAMADDSGRAASASLLILDFGVPWVRSFILL